MLLKKTFKHAGKTYEAREANLGFPGLVIEIREAGDFHVMVAYNMMSAQNMSLKSGIQKFKKDHPYG